MVIEEVHQQLDAYIEVMKSQDKMPDEIIISEVQYHILSGQGRRDVRDYRGYTLIVKSLKRPNHERENRR